MKIEAKGLIELKPPKLPFGIEHIKNILPHRYPFLLVDRIVELEPKKRAVGLKAVTYNEPFFQGHFPDLPIMPGVLILESMAQVGGIMILSEDVLNNFEQVPVLASVEKAKFKRPVRPGDTLKVITEVLWIRLNTGKIKAYAEVEGKRVAEAELLFSFVPRDKL